MNKLPLNGGYYYDNYPYAADSRPGYSVYYDREPYAYPGGVPSRTTAVPLFPPPDRYQMIPGNYLDAGYGDYPFVPEQRNLQFMVRPTRVSSATPKSPASSAALTTNLTEDELRKITESLQKSGSEYQSTIVGGPNSDGETIIVTPDPQKPSKWRVTQQKKIIPAKKDQTNLRSSTGQYSVSAGVVQPPATSYPVLPPKQIMYQPVPSLGDYYGRGPAQVPYDPYLRY